MRRELKKVSMPDIKNSIRDFDANSDVHTGKSKELTNRILSLMQNKSWLQRELAENMGKSEAEISKLLSGYHNFTLRTIAKFEAVLNDDIITIPNTIENKGAKVVSIDQNKVNGISFDEYSNAILVKGWEKSL